MKPRYYEGRIMKKSELCEPCKFFVNDEDWFFGWGCIKKDKQLGEMWPELCGEGSCVYFKKRDDVDN